MPVVGLPLTTTTIGSLTDEVIAKVENRTSDRLRCEVWLRDALIEIAANPGYRNEFDELEVTGPAYNLTALQQEYSADLFKWPDDTNLSFLDFMLWTDPPFNANRKQLIWKSYQYTDRNRQNAGLPANWYRFQDNIGFDPLPSLAYQVQARYYRFHQIDDSCLANTEILLPRDWHEILVLCAAERGFIELLEYEKSAAIHTLLYGDPAKPDRPGLVAGRLKRRERELWRREATLAPTVRPYSPSGR